MHLFRCIPPVFGLVKRGKERIYWKKANPYLLKFHVVKIFIDRF